ARRLFVQPGDCSRVTLESGSGSASAASPHSPAAGVNGRAGSLISTLDMEERGVPLLIVGGSLVGMFMAALLGQLGVRALVAERDASTAIHPRAAFVYQRTMGVVRGLGVEDVVRSKS